MLYKRYKNVQSVLHPSKNMMVAITWRVKFVNMSFVGCVAVYTRQSILKNTIFLGAEVYTS